MTTQKVNTVGISAAAGKITQADYAIHVAYSRVNAQLRALEAAWSSPAADIALESIRQLLKGEDGRSAVLTNFSAVLNQSVSLGYDESELRNTKLSDLFL